MKADSARSAQPRRPADPFARDGEGLGKRVEGRVTNLIGETGEARSEDLAVLGGEHRSRDGDADRGANLPASHR